MSVIRFACLAVAACLAVQTVLNAQGKGKKPAPTDQPAAAWMETDGRLFPSQSPVDWEISGEDPCESSPPGTINGDGTVYVGSGTDITTGDGAFLRADGEFVLELRSGRGRNVYVNFLSPFLPSTSPTPRKEFCAAALEQFHLNTHFLHDDGSDDVGKSLIDIPPGETYPARINSSFILEGITYQIRFNAAGYPGSTNVKVTRGPTLDLPSDKWWVIETGLGEQQSGDVAQLVSPALSRKGNQGPNDEGFYHLPFKITLTTDPASFP
jgi:hypothetical protein